MWIYHKPVGELCSDFDPSAKKLFLIAFKKIGKVNLVELDLNSEGLLLLTNKGYIKDLLPKNKIISYLVKTWGKDLNAKNIEEMSKG